MYISVIIPAYNRSNTIEYCLNSILQQTYKPHEIIIVDDCSNDDMVNKITSLNNDIIKVITLDKTHGAQAARNIGIKNAKGDWIAFQDSDDEWLLDKLEMQLKDLKNVDYDPFTVVHTNCYRYYPERKIREIWELPTIEGNNTYKDLLAKPGPMFQGMLVSRVALKKINYLDENVPSYQEWDTSIRLAKYCRFIHIQDPLFNYYLHDNETISTNFEKNTSGYEYIVEKHKNDILRICGEEVYNNHKIINGKQAMQWGLYDQAKNELQKIKVKNSYIKFMIFCANFHIKPYPAVTIANKIKQIVYN